MLRINQIREWPHQLDFLTSGQSNRPQINHLPFYRAMVEGLSPEDGTVVLYQSQISTLSTLFDCSKWYIFTNMRSLLGYFKVLQLLLKSRLLE